MLNPSADLVSFIGNVSVVIMLWTAVTTVVCKRVQAVEGGTPAASIRVLYDLPHPEVTVQLSLKLGFTELSNGLGHQDIIRKLGGFDDLCGKVIGLRLNAITYVLNIDKTYTMQKEKILIKFQKRAALLRHCVMQQGGFFMGGQDERKCKLLRHCSAAEATGGSWLLYKEGSCQDCGPDCKTDRCGYYFLAVISDSSSYLKRSVVMFVADKGR